MLQYITNTECKIPVAEQIKKVVDGGCRWVVIRMDNDEEISKVVAEIKQLCVDTDTFLLLDSKAELAKEVNIGGVYLHKNGTFPSKARMILGPAAVIGLSTSSIEEIEAVKAMDIDYVGIGPFRSDNETESLGTNEIRDISNAMREREIELAHVAYGGIKTDDVAELMETGINGIAVSRAIAFAPDITEETKKYMKALEPFMK